MDCTGLSTEDNRMTYEICSFVINGETGSKFNFWPVSLWHPNYFLQYK